MSQNNYYMIIVENNSKRKKCSSIYWHMSANELVKTTSKSWGVILNDNKLSLNSAFAKLILNNNESKMKTYVFLSDQLFRYKYLT